MHMYPMNEEQILFEMNLRKKINQPIEHAYLDVDKFNPVIFDTLKQHSLSLNTDNSMINDDIIYLENDANDNMYYLDCHSGLIYVLIDNKFHTIFYGNNSSQFDIFDACYFRKYLTDEKFRNSSLAMSEFGEILSLHYLGTSLENIFSTPILEYTVNSKKDLKEIITHLNESLSKSRFFVKLWFRGQRTEYLTHRTRTTLNKLGIPETFSDFPSLIPSVGRCITKDNFYDIRTQNMYWNEALGVWRLTQSAEFSEEFSPGKPLYNKIIKSIDPVHMAKFRFEYPYDLSEYLDGASRSHKSNILTTQQYGGYSSMLDITDDLDVALFFTQSYFNTRTKKFEICNSTDSNVIYVFAQGRNTSTVDMSKEAFYYSLYDDKIELPKRISNQKCGLLTGANALGYNAYAYSIIAKIKLNCIDASTTRTVEDMFPSMQEDSLYRTFFDAQPKLEGLYG